MPGPLDGIRCLDLTANAPGPFCTMILGDLGADVIRIYDPRGVSGRRAEAAGDAAPMLEIAGGASPHNALLRNKRSLGIDLKDPDGKRIFLAASARRRRPGRGDETRPRRHARHRLPVPL